MGQRSRARVVAGLAALVALVSGALGVAPAGADGAPSTSGFYLALGASESLGWQPSASYPLGHATDHGYANDLVAYEAARNVHLDLTQLGCPGENTATMITGGDRCYRGQGSQLASAVTFLEAHRAQAGIVTLDLGFNNVMSCMRAGDIDPTCVDAHLAQVQSQLTYVVGMLRDAAGPQVSFVGLDHYDPFVVDQVGHPGFATFAHRSDDAVERLNAVSDQVFTLAGVAVANVAGAFGLVGSRGTDRVSRVGLVGQAATACDLTWMCHGGPRGPNIHPDAEGYQAIARSIEAVLTPPWS